MDPRVKVLVDFDEAFNSFTGIPLSTQIDALCLIYSHAEVTLWYHNEKKTAQIQRWIQEYVKPQLQKNVKLSRSRPSNRIMWLTSVLNVACKDLGNFDFVYSRLFPLLPIRGDHKILFRIDDVFGSHKSPLVVLTQELLKQSKLKIALAKCLRTLSYRRLPKDSTVKVFNSNFTKKEWNAIYNDASALDIVAYPPTQFAVEDHINGKNVSQEDYRLDHPYFLMIGGQRQRKDPVSIINQWALELEKNRFDLVVVGKINLTLLSNGALSGLSRNRLRIVSNLDVNELRKLITQSRGIVFNSNGEGFGNPIAEAIYLKKPIVCNDLPVFKEVGAGYAHFYPSGEYDKAIVMMRSIVHTNQKEQSGAINDFSFGASVKIWQKIILHT